MRQSRVEFRPPSHCYAVATVGKTEAVSGDRIRQTDWQHRQGARGARGAMLITEALDCIPVVSALPGRVQPCGPLLLEVQGQYDLHLAEGQAAKLAKSMRQDSKLCSDTTIQEGVSAGLSALAEWRAGADVEGREGGASRVCWRAVVREMSRDTWGDSVEMSAFSPESLAGSALPLPSLQI